MTKPKDSKANVFGRQFVARLGAVLFGALVFAGIAVGAAQAKDAYLVEDITSRQFADNAVEARNAAMSAVVTDALETVFRRLARSKDLTRLPKADERLANRLLTSLQIRNETGGLTSYAITAHVRFDKAGVDRVFARAGVRAYTKPGPSVLLVPAHVQESATVMYEAATEWDAALREASAAPWLMSLSVAEGAPEDRFEPLERLRANDRVSFDFLRVRYGTHGAVLAELMEPAEDGLPTQLRVVGDTGAGPIDAVIELDVAADDVMAAASARVVELLDDHWKQVQAVGNAAGVRINGISINPVAIEIPQSEIEPDADAVLAELRLDGSGKTPKAPRKVRQIAAGDGSPDTTGSTTGSSHSATEQSFSAFLAIGLDEGALRSVLSSIPGMTGFMVSEDNARNKVTLWFRGNLDAMQTHLESAGYSVGHDLVTNAPLISVRQD